MLQKPLIKWQGKIYADFTVAAHVTIKFVPESILASVAIMFVARQALAEYLCDVNAVNRD